MRREGWPIGPVPAAAALSVLLALSLYFLPRASLGPAREQRDPSRTITIEDAGVDSRRIERTMTMPLEDALSVIPGVVQMRSISEYGRSRVTVIAAGEEGRAGLSAALRDAVQRVAEGLPASAQKPEILSSSLSQRPVFIASVRAAGRSGEELRDRVEREVKPCFARISGAGEVETGGGAPREIHVRVDPRRAGLHGLSLADIAGQIARQAVLVPAGTLSAAGRAAVSSVAGRMRTAGELAALPLRLPGGGNLPLRSVASVEHGLRERESISRVDGRQVVVISVHSSGTANLISLSRGLRAETARWEREGLAFDILLDQGWALEQAVRGILSALLQGLAVVTAILPLFVRQPRRMAALAALLPVTGLIAVGALCAGRVSLDQHILSGLAVGIGTILDTGIIVSEQKSAHSMRSLVPSLAASLATTLIVLVPLFFLDFAAPGIRQVAVAVGLLLVVSFGIDMLFLPAIFLAPGPRGPGTHRFSAAPPRAVKRVTRLLRRRSLRALHALIDVMIRRRWVVLGASGLLGLGMIVALLLMGSDFSQPVEDDSLYARLEFEPGATVESVDERTLSYTRLLAGGRGVGSIQSIARRGSAEMQVRFDPSRTSRAEAAALLREAGRRIPGGFVYLPDWGDQGGRGIELSIRGDDDERLRGLAREAARLLDGAPGVRQVVLNFKDPPPALVVTVDRDRAAGLGVRTAEAAAALRWALHGPVAMKWIEGDRELDLRVMADMRPGRLQGGTRGVTRADILAVPVRAMDGSVRLLGGLARLSVRPEGGKIFRTDRQRTVSLTVHLSRGSIDSAARRIRAALEGLRLPAGYAIEMDREVRELTQSFRLLWLALGLGVVFIFIVLAGFGESLVSPVAVLSILPPSLAFPVIAYATLGEPLRIPVLIGFIMLSGMVVNNSILVIDAIRGLRAVRATGKSSDQATAPCPLRGALHRAIRGRLRPLLITSVATIAGTVPLLFARSQGTGFLSALAFVVFWGMLGSLASTILVVPALASAAPFLVRPRGEEGA